MIEVEAKADTRELFSENFCPRMRKEKICRLLLRPGNATSGALR